MLLFVGVYHELAQLIHNFLGQDLMVLETRGQGSLGIPRADLSNRVVWTLRNRAESCWAN